MYARVVMYLILSLEYTESVLPSLSGFPFTVLSV